MAQMRMSGQLLDRGFDVVDNLIGEDGIVRWDMQRDIQNVLRQDGQDVRATTHPGSAAIVFA